MSIESTPTGVSRRQFVKASTAAALTTPFVSEALSAVPLQDRDTLRIGLIGCGGRGTGAAYNATEASTNATIVALADVFADRLNDSRGHLRKIGDRGTVADRHCYVGFDAYQELIDNADVDVVILATPPHFRPIHFEAAVRAGKHVFMEKPVAVDPAGIRTVMAAAELAKASNLSVVAGTQRRHEACYLAAMEKIRSGAIGEVTAARCYWNQGGLWVKKPTSEWTEMEWQLRNWLYFTWLSGDHICEQHIHNLDVINWAMGGPPTRALGLGGRQSRTGDEYGHVFDHFAIEYEYDNGRFSMSMCRQQDGCPGRVKEIIHGTEGRLITSSGHAEIKGARPWRFEDDNPNPYVIEHRDLHASIHAGAGLNEGQRVAESTLTAIMGRMSAYTGQEVTWEQALNSQLDLAPAEYRMGDLPTTAVAIPGQTKLI